MPGMFKLLLLLDSVLMCATDGETLRKVEIKDSSWLKRFGVAGGKKLVVSAPEDCDCFSLSMRACLDVQSRKSTPRSLRRCLISEMERKFKPSAMEAPSSAYESDVCEIRLDKLIDGATNPLDVLKTIDRRKAGSLTNIVAVFVVHVH